MALDLASDERQPQLAQCLLEGDPSPGCVVSSLPVIAGTASHIRTRDLHAVAPQLSLYRDAKSLSTAVHVVCWLYGSVHVSR